MLYLSMAIEMLYSKWMLYYTSSRDVCKELTITEIGIEKESEMVHQTQLFVQQ